VTNYAVAYDVEFEGYYISSGSHVFLSISQVREILNMQEVKIAELEKDISFYRCCALSGEIPDDLSRPSSIALQVKALEEQGK
jgi:hypothetical protein